MKRLFILVMMVAILAAAASPTFAQGRRSRRVYEPAQTASGYYDSQAYYDYEDYSRNRSFWDKHRDKLTLAIGAGAGAAVGGLIGGKKGAAIGALSGLGGSALYTYKIRNRGYGY